MKKTDPRQLMPPVSWSCRKYRPEPPVDVRHQDRAYALDGTPKGEIKADVAYWRRTLDFLAEAAFLRKPQRTRDKAILRAMTSSAALMAWPEAVDRVAFVESRAALRLVGSRSGVPQIADDLAPLSKSAALGQIRTNPPGGVAPHKMAEPQIADFAYSRPGAARNLVDHVRCRRSRVDDHHRLGKALAAFQAVLLPASPDSLNGK